MVFGEASGTLSGALELLKMTGNWDLTLRYVVQIYGLLVESVALRHRTDPNLKLGVSLFFRNVGKLLSDHEKCILEIVQYSNRRQYSKRQICCIFKSGRCYQYFPNMVALFCVNYILHKLVSVNLKEACSFLNKLR